MLPLSQILRKWGFIDTNKIYTKWIHVPLQYLVVQV